MWHLAQGLESNSDLIIFHDPIPRSCYACSSAWMQETALGNQLQMTLNWDPWRQLRLLQSCLRWRPDQFLSLLCSLSFFSFHIRRKLHYPGLVITRFCSNIFFLSTIEKKSYEEETKKNLVADVLSLSVVQIFLLGGCFFRTQSLSRLVFNKKVTTFCGCVFSGASANLGSNHPLMWLTSFESNLLKVEI